MTEAYPTFRFWDLIERLETLIVIFCKAHRQKKFPCTFKHWNNFYHSSSLWIIQTMLDGHPCTLEI